MSTGRVCHLSFWSPLGRFMSIPFLLYVRHRVCLNSGCWFSRLIEHPSALIDFGDVPLKICLRRPFLQQDEGISVFYVFMTVTETAPFDPCASSIPFIVSKRSSRFLGRTIIFNVACITVPPATKIIIRACFVIALTMIVITSVVVMSVPVIASVVPVTVPSVVALPETSGTCDKRDTWLDLC